MCEGVCERERESERKREDHLQNLKRVETDTTMPLIAAL